MDDLVSTAWLAQNLGQPDLTIVDSSWFMPALGRDARKEYLAAHIPGARNLPYPDLYNQDGTLKSPDEIRGMFLAAGVDPEKPFVASCGSGVTANSLIFAARMLGNRDTRLYDGSWSEWGADPKMPKQQGPA